MKATFLALILIGLTPFVPLSAQYPDYREGPDFMPGELDTLKKLMIPLPWANREINEVNDFIDGRTYHGEIATEDHFRGVAPGFGILHLATHTFLNDDRPLYSKMVFSPDSIHDRDGFLNTYEVAQLALQRVILHPIVRHHCHAPEDAANRSAVCSRASRCDLLSG